MMLQVHDPEFMAFKSLPFVRPRIIDVGANSGQSIRSFKLVYEDAVIYSYEPNPVHFAELTLVQEKFADGDVHINRFGLGEQSGICRFYIPTMNDIQYLEETTMDRSIFELPWIKEKFEERGGKLDFIAFDAPVSTGDSQGLSPDIIKLDVEGVELPVLLGFSKTIERHRPVIFSENTNYNVNYHLEHAGYTAWISGSDDVTKLQKPGEFRTNTFFVPKERLEEFGLAP